jgi:hypothetical protein
MNVPLIVAGSLGILAAAVHGGAGEVLVVRRLSPETLAPSPFGGSRMTLAMLHVSWHIGTIAFLTLGVAMLVAGTSLDDDAARAIGLVGAAAFTGFAALAAGLGAAHTRSARGLYRHPGPAGLALTAALAWWGAL